AVRCAAVGEAERGEAADLDRLTVVLSEIAARDPNIADGAGHEDGRGCIRGVDIADVHGSSERNAGRVDAGEPAGGEITDVGRAQPAEATVGGKDGDKCEVGHAVVVD